MKMVENGNVPMLILFGGRLEKTTPNVSLDSPMLSSTVNMEMSCRVSPAENVTITSEKT